MYGHLVARMAKTHQSGLFCGLTHRVKKARAMKKEGWAKITHCVNPLSVCVELLKGIWKLSTGYPQVVGF